jgi:hypothetical protein
MEGRRRVKGAVPSGGPQCHSMSFVTHDTLREKPSTPGVQKFRGPNPARDLDNSVRGRPRRMPLDAAELPSKTATNSSVPLHREDRQQRAEDWAFAVALGAGSGLLIKTARAGRLLGEASGARRGSNRVEVALAADFRRWSRLAELGPTTSEARPGQERETRRHGFGLRFSETEKAAGLAAGWRTHWRTSATSPAKWHIRNIRNGLENRCSGNPLGWPAASERAGARRPSSLRSWSIESSERRSRSVAASWSQGARRARPTDLISLGRRVRRVPPLGLAG